MINALFTNLRPCGVMVVLRTFTFNKVPFDFGGRNDIITPAQVPNSPEEHPSGFITKPFTHMLSLGCGRPAAVMRVTDVPRIEQVGVRKMNMSPFVLRPNRRATDTSNVHHTSHQTPSTPDRGAQPSFEIILPTAGPSSPSADEGICHSLLYDSGYAIPATAQHVMGCISG
jgi:hypothetical protein